MVSYPTNQGNESKSTSYEFKTIGDWLRRTAYLSSHLELRLFQTAPYTTSDELEKFSGRLWRFNYKPNLLPYLDSMKRRHKSEIVRDLLSVCNGGASITKVMFYGYLTHRQAKCYLGELVEQELLKSDTQRRFFTTPTGMEYLLSLERISELLPMLTKISRGEEISRLQQIKRSGWETQLKI